MSFFAVDGYWSISVLSSFKIGAAQKSKDNTPFKNSVFKNTELICTDTKKQIEWLRNVKN